MERPLPRLLQQLYRKGFTGHFVITDQTRDESEVYVRGGSPVHVCRPVDTDRLDNLLVEYGLVSPEIVAQASSQVAEGSRLGDVLERMGALDKGKLAEVLKAQVTRKLIRLFFVAEGTYAVYLSPHGYGEGGDHALMRVDPRGVIYPGIRAAYDLPRVTRELARLAGQRFRLADISSAFVAALGIPPEDGIVEALREGWMTLDDLDAVTARPFDVRSVVLALFYSDLLQREPVVRPLADVAASRGTPSYQHTATDSLFEVPVGSGVAVSLASAAPPAPAADTAGRAPVAAPVPVAVPAPASTRPSGSMPAVKAFKPAATPSAGLPSATPAVVPAGPVSPGAPVVRSPFVTAVRAGVKAVPATSTKHAPHAGSAPAPEVVRASIQDMAQKIERSTHFEILGVGQKASADEVGTAFVRAARQFHPDRLTSAGLADLQPMAERILARINEAAMVLGNPARRAEYVDSLAAGAQQVSHNLPSLLEAENVFLKGEVYLKKGDYPKAIESFTTATLANPSEPQYQAYLAWARFDDPRARKEIVVRETLKILEGVLKDRPKFVRGFYWVGQLWKFLNETGKAEQAFREAVQIDTSFIEASRELRLIDMRKSKSPAGKAGGKAEAGKGRFWKR